ncbi:MAG: hypothetical protein WBP36_03680, partial [Thermoanaerobaculia bacterium]
MKHANQNMLVWCAAVLLCTAAPMLAQGPGLYELDLVSDEGTVVGMASVWNSPKKLHFKLMMNDGVEITDSQVWVGADMADIPLHKGKPKFSAFPYGMEFDPGNGMYDLVLDLQDDLGFSWGSQNSELRVQSFMIHGDFETIDADTGDVISDGFIAKGPLDFNDLGKYWAATYLLAHPRRGQFIDSPVQGLYYVGPTQEGVIGFDEDGYVEEQGGFSFFPGESIEFSIGWVPLGTATAAKKVSPLDLFSGVSVEEYPVLGVARTLQSLDNDQSDGKIVIAPEVAECFSDVVYDRFGSYEVIWEDPYEVDELLDLAVGGVYDDSNSSFGQCDGLTVDNSNRPADLKAVSDAEAAANLEAGLNASGIFRKNLSKTEDWAETKQKLDVMPVYIPGRRSNGDPSLCVDVNEDGIYDEGEDTLGVPYEEWRLGGDPLAEECDPRDFEDPSACQVTLIECRDVAKPIVVTYMEKIDISDANTDFNECGPEPTHNCRFSYDIVTAVSRDDGNTWKRMNVSRMADLSSFELKTGENFPGTVGSPYLKVNDNYILNVWQSKFCKSGNPRYAIDNCELYPDDCVDLDGDGIPESVCRGNLENGTQVCEPDYLPDNEYYVTDIWGVRGQQRSVDYDEVDDVADLGIGEIPYSCLWAARG